MRLTHIDAVMLETDSLNDSIRYFSEFGLVGQNAADGAAKFATASGSQISIYDRRRPMPLESTGSSGLLATIFAVDAASDVAAIVSALESDRPVRTIDDVAFSTDDDGRHIGFRVGTTGKYIPAPNGLNIFGARPLRGFNERVDFESLPTPAAIAHITMFSPHVERSCKFYEERLGLRLADRFQGWRLGFLRFPGPGDHHSIAFVNKDDRTGLHHISFHLPDLNAIMLRGTEMIKHGWSSYDGPGRHRVGSNYFWYFDSPCGAPMEFTADVDRADDDWVPRVWETKPSNAAVWRTSNVPVIDP
jgi:catechol 2,3-dioxygenase-like lactoylglutathione lyase family enzyme